MRETTRLRLLAAAAGGIAAGALLAPERALSLAGLPPSPATSWILRLLGVRDLCFAGMLSSSASGSDRRLRLVLRRAVTVSQATDLCITGWLSVRGQVAPPVAVAVAGGALLTIAVSGWPGE
jgi:hypothetical protein